MNRVERKATLTFLHSVAVCASRAADKTGTNRSYDELREVIAKQERQHRALGRRMVGNIGARMTIEQTCDYFVARCLAEGRNKTEIADLAGTRQDYVIAAILMAAKGFREAFRVYLATSFPELSFNDVMAKCEASDYCELVQS